MRAWPTQTRMLDAVLFITTNTGPCLSEWPKGPWDSLHGIYTERGREPQRRSGDQVPVLGVRLTDDRCYTRPLSL